MKTPAVGYVLKRFPRISETFILNEILELERQGDPIEIFALREPANEVRHEALKRLHAQVNMTSSRRVALLMATAGGTLHVR